MTFQGSGTVVAITYSAISEQGVHEVKSALGMPERFMGVSSVTLPWIRREAGTEPTLENGNGHDKSSSSVEHPLKEDHILCRNPHATYGRMAFTLASAGRPESGPAKLRTSWWTAAFAMPYPIMKGVPFCAG